MFPGLASQAGVKPTHTQPRLKIPTAKGEVHYHVTAPTSEHNSVKTQLKHADFAARNKYRGNV